MGLVYGKETGPEDQRSIILLGETGAGKSAFGNFLLKSYSFKTGDGMLSTTQSVEQKSCQYTEDNLNIQLHVFDLPGLNDPRKVDTTYLNNTYSALKNCAKCMSTLFAIVVNISDREALPSAVREIQKFLDKIELPDFNLTDNALLVFTHADKLGSTVEEVNSSLFRTIEACPPLCKLWTLVRFRHVLVDSPRYTSDDVYWQEKMREVLHFTRPKIRVLMLGHMSAQTELLLLLRRKKRELGGADELLPYESDVREVTLETEGCHLTFEKCFDLSSLDDVSEQESKEKSNALNQLNLLINSIAETHTFSAFCVVIKMDRLKSSFIEGIRAFATSLSEDKVDMFYNRCFFLFVHSNRTDALTQCDLAFSQIADMREMKGRMSGRVAITNTHPDTSTELVSGFLKEVISFSYSMKQKCYGKEFVSSVLSSGFDLPAPDPLPPDKIQNTDKSSYWPSKLTLSLLAVSAGGGILALAGGGILAASVVLTGGAAAPAVAPVMLFAAPMVAQVAAPVLAPAVVAGGASILGGTLGVIGLGANTAVGSAFLYKFISEKKRRRDAGEREYEYDFSTGALDYTPS